MKRQAQRGNRSWRAPLGIHPLARAAIVLLALVQIIAPTWHVCALGGFTRSHDHAKQVKIWKPKCGGGPKCSCVPPKDALVSPTGEVLSAPDTDCAHDTCLALLLMAMPGAVVAPFHFSFFAAPSPAFATSSVARPFVASMPQPPARGPPFSL